MPVAEPDDGDTGGEVEVAAARVVHEPDSVPLDECHRRRRVDREQCGLEQRAHPTTTVEPISVRSPPRAACAAASSFGTIPPSKRPAPTSVLGLLRVDPLEQRVRRGTHRGRRSGREPVGAETDRECGRGLVGIHVERAFGQRSDDRDQTGVERVDNRCGRARQRLADEAELRHAAREETDLVAGERHRARPDRLGHLRVHREEAFAHNLENFGVS